MSGSNLSGNQKRRMKSASRLYAVQALFQMEASQLPIDVVSKEFEEHRMGVELDGAHVCVGLVALEHIVNQTRHHISELA